MSPYEIIWIGALAMFALIASVGLGFVFIMWVLERLP